jgi:cell division protein FtsB
MMPPIKRLAGKVNRLSETIAQHEAVMKTHSDERAALQRQIEQLREELSRERAKSDGTVFSWLSMLLAGSARDG